VRGGVAAHQGSPTTVPRLNGIFGLMRENSSLSPGRSVVFRLCPDATSECPVSNGKVSHLSIQITFIEVRLLKCPDEPLEQAFELRSTAPVRRTKYITMSIQDIESFFVI